MNPIGGYGGGYGGLNAPFVDNDESDGLLDDDGDLDYGRDGGGGGGDIGF